MFAAAGTALGREGAQEQRPERTDEDNLLSSLSRRALACA